MLDLYGQFEIQVCEGCNGYIKIIVTRQYIGFKLDSLGLCGTRQWLSSCGRGY